MDAILGHGSEEVLRVRAWDQSDSDAVRSTHSAARTPLQVFCAGWEREHGNSDLQHPQTCEHDMVMIQWS